MLCYLICFTTHYWLELSVLVSVFQFMFTTGVPVSNQWDKNGYIYPIQVAQYGLSHYSKLKTEEGVQSDR